MLEFVGRELFAEQTRLVAVLLVVLQAPRVDVESAALDRIRRLAFLHRRRYRRRCFFRWHRVLRRQGADVKRRAVDRRHDHVRSVAHLLGVVQVVLSLVVAVGRDDPDRDAVGVCPVGRRNAARVLHEKLLHGARRQRPMVRFRLLHGHRRFFVRIMAPLIFLVVVLFQWIVGQAQATRGHIHAPDFGAHGALVD